MVYNLAIMSGDTNQITSHGADQYRLEGAIELEFIILIRLILEWNFSVSKSHKKPTKFLTDFCSMKLVQKFSKNRVTFWES